MTKEEEIAFREERRKGIGGSDFDDLLEITQYGCQLKLWYSKTGVDPDYKRNQMPLKRGKRLEPIARAYLAEKLGEEITEHNGPIIAEGKPWRRVNLDGTICSGSTAVELKTLGMHSFSRIKAHGLPKQYICQLQWGIGLLSAINGVYGIYQPDTDQLIYFEVAFDIDLYNSLGDKVDKWWQDHIVQGIKPMPSWGESIGDACYNCEYRKSCRGLNSNGSLSEEKF